MKGGIRYFDIRIYRDKDGVFRFYHGYVKGGLAALPTFELVRDFLREHPQEFVVLHFQHFDKINFDEHRLLINSVLTIFDMMPIAKCDYDGEIGNVTLNKIRMKKQQVFLVSYDPMTEQVDNCTFWNGSALINPYYPTTKWETMAKTLGIELVNRTIEYKKLKPDRFFVYQGVLTPDAKYIIEHLEGTLKDLALPATKYIATEWMPNMVAKNCTNAGAVNIIMCDFINYYDYVTNIAMTNWNFDKCNDDNDFLESLMTLEETIA